MNVVFSTKRHLAESSPFLHSIMDPFLATLGEYLNTVGVGFDSSWASLDETIFEFFHDFINRNFNDLDNLQYTMYMHEAQLVAKNLVSDIEGILAGLNNHHQVVTGVSYLRRVGFDIVLWVELTPVQRSLSSLYEELS
jgi:hypothetical protein